MTIDANALNFTKGNGLVTVVTVDDGTEAVLMVAHADRQAIELTINTGEMHYTSRTRGLWRKGATSGAIQRVVSLTADCDGDAVLARVTRAGPACHTGTDSCFGPTRDAVLKRLDRTIGERALAGREGGSYTQRLLSDANLRLKKIGEEAAELVHAAAIGDRARAVEEAADLLYHSLVVLRALDAGLDDVEAALARRASAIPRTASRP